MKNNSDTASGLTEVESSDSTTEATEYDRDKLLIELTVRLNRIHRGAFASYGKYVLPVAVAFSLSGFIIYFAFEKAEHRPPFWLLFIGDLIMISGLFLLLLVVTLLVFDFFRGRYLDSISNKSMAEFDCVFLGTAQIRGKERLTCTYFNREFDHMPLCVICPMYKNRDENTETKNSENVKS